MNKLIVITTSKVDGVYSRIKDINHARITEFLYPERTLSGAEQLDLTKSLDLSKFPDGMIIVTQSLVISQGLLNRKSATHENIDFYYVDDNHQIYDDPLLELFKDEAFAPWSYVLDIAIGVIDNSKELYNYNGMRE